MEEIIEEIIGELEQLAYERRALLAAARGVKKMRRLIEVNMLAHGKPVASTELMVEIREGKVRIVSIRNPGDVLSEAKEG